MDLHLRKFNVKEFLKMIPDPETHFKENRFKQPWVKDCTEYVIKILGCMYQKMNPILLRILLLKSTDFTNACKILSQFKKFQKPQIYPSAYPHWPLLHEIAYVINRKEIQHMLTQKKKQIEKARKAGLTKTCSCCFNEDVLPEDMFKCEANCQLCKECIRKNVEDSYSNRKLSFECLNNCDAKLTVQVLKGALAKTLYQKIYYDQLVKELKAAKINNLEFCPDCNCAIVVSKNCTIFQCPNLSCKSETCRECKMPSHGPCDANEVNDEAPNPEIESTDSIKCYKCRVPTINDEGGNSSNEGSGWSDEESDSSDEESDSSDEESDSSDEESGSSDEGGDSSDEESDSDDEGCSLSTKRSNLGYCSCGIKIFNSQ